MKFILPILLILCLAYVFYRLKPKRVVYKGSYDYESYVSNLSSFEREFWLLLSLYREKSIMVDMLACNVAYHHSYYMADEKKVSHDHLQDRVNLMKMQGGYPYAEIVGASYNVDSLFDKFKNSEIHNKAMLNMNYNCCGISIVEVGQVLFATIVFIKI